MAHLQERAEWKCVLEGGMAQYVMTSGTVWMPELSADNWDSMILVCKQTIAIPMYVHAHVFHLIVKHTIPVLVV